MQLSQSNSRIIDVALGVEQTVGLLVPTIFGMDMSDFGGFYFCAVLLILGFFLTLRIDNSPFGMMLRADQVEPDPQAYTGFNTRPPLYHGRLRDLGHVCRPRRCAAVVTDPLVGAGAHAVDRLGRGGSDDSRAVLAPCSERVIKYFENIFSAYHNACQARG